MNTNFTEFMFWSFNQFSKPDAIRIFETTGDHYYQKANRLQCADGYSISCQAGSFNYCAPRESFFNPDIDQGNFFDEYTAFELGFPNQGDELLTPYAEDPDSPCDTVYGYVPKAIIVALIQKHGGLVHELEGEIVPSGILEVK